MNAKLSTPTNRQPETQLVNLLARHYGNTQNAVQPLL